MCSGADLGADQDLTCSRTILADVPVGSFSIPHIFRYHIGESEIESLSMSLLVAHTEDDPADDKVHPFPWPNVSFVGFMYSSTPRH